jgi:hypothetical protein
VRGQDRGRQAAVARWCLGRQKRERECGVKKLLSVVKESAEPEILGRGT